MAVEAVSGLLESYLEHGDDFTIPNMPDLPDWYRIEPESDFETELISV
ncbi:MAG: hypothetical protein LBF63_01030 [Treponema sp.]|jgi:hypothetical protein|nr:hypothetical protein [Treponema sp.]